MREIKFNKLPFEHVDYLRDIASICHHNAVAGGWWHDINTGERLDRNRPEMYTLMHSELSEAFEGFRKNINDSHLPHRKSEEVELADLLIRILDYAYAYNHDVALAMKEKLEYNETRPDHKIENRLKSNGKKI